ncbi:MAG: PAS domain-containing sensor histidine kinase [Alphaproteobacteria bacterium]|nr:PAS domain-containing sensor histidine kinase [Alphaproteobacteria bacterium]
MAVSEPSSNSEALAGSDLPDRGEKAPRPSRISRLLDWAERHQVGRRAAVVLTFLAIALGIATYGALTGAGPFGPDPRLVFILLNANLALLLLIAAIVGHRLVRIYLERRRGIAGAKLHGRIVILFSLVAVVPAIVVAVFSALFLNLGVQAWFNDRVQAALQSANAASAAYLFEHRQTIRADVLAMAADLNREAPVLVSQPRRLQLLLNAQARLRNLPEAVIFDGAGRVLASSEFSFSLAFESIDAAAVGRARGGEVIVLTSDRDDQVRALVRLDRFVNAYLVVARFVDPAVLGHIAKTQQAVQEYERLEQQRSGLQITFTLVFVLVAVLLLLASMWVGLIFAGNLSRPIGDLIGAANAVGSGDLTARVAMPGDPNDELGLLARAFNNMTSQIGEQRDDLVAATRQIDERRRFTEAVLAGVSSGVIGLDAEGRIELPNRSASDLLGVDLETHVGAYLSEVIPAMGAMLTASRDRPERRHEGDIAIHTPAGDRTFHVRVTVERGEGATVRGFVVTLDDLTALVTAQRKAAWADVARRIAHEIKNPLTPIQLSAERLKRKYAAKIDDEENTFSAYTDTIVRHVGDIGRMVDEFSNFARMPQPEMRPMDLVPLLKDILALRRTAHPGVTFEEDIGSGDSAPVGITADARQVERAITNVIQNALDAIERNGGTNQQSRISVSLYREGFWVVLRVRDTGPGLPEAERDRLLEPYVTTRKKGTGLGLAIVHRIMEDHGGRVELSDRKDGPGAEVLLIFPVS